MMPSGWVKFGGNDGCDGVAELCTLEESIGARAFNGCCRMLTRSSVNRLDARGAIPGRVTVHCWSRVASLRDCD